MKNKISAAQQARVFQVVHATKDRGLPVVRAAFKKSDADYLDKIEVDTGLNDIPSAYRDIFAARVRDIGYALKAQDSHVLPNGYGFAVFFIKQQ